MNLLQSRLKFRQRTPWEAVDLGRRLINDCLGYYAALYAMMVLPFALIGSVLLWQYPAWLVVMLWWFKPMYEYGILSALSVHVFQPLPPLKTAITTGWKLMWRPCVFGDVTWRRFRPTRSFAMPIQQLEQLSGSDYRSRHRELSRYGSNTATGLTLMGNALEGIWLYSLMILVYWLLYGNFVQQGLVQPSHMNELNNLYNELQDSWFNQELSSFFQYTAWAYCLTLVFWGPFYVASGFTLYLNARTQSEAWDIRLIWQQLAERLRGGVTWCLSLIMASVLALALADNSHAEALPDEQTVTQHREQVLERDPFYHVDTQNQWCWQSCDAKKQSDYKPSNHDFPGTVQAGAAFLQPLGYVVLGLLVLGLLYGLWRWWAQHDGHANHADDVADAPTTLFGLDVRSEALPKDVSHQARLLLQTDPRAALSLLYRATLAQLIHKQHLPIKHHHTEGQVLQLVAGQWAMLSPFFANLTNAWLRTAYGHQQLPLESLNRLCQDYAQHFESGVAA